MNQYVFLRRMRGPMMLLVFAITAILAEYTSIGYDKSWPLYLIAWGAWKVAENAILAQNPPAPPPAYPGYPAAPGPYRGPGGPMGPMGGPGGSTTTSIVPANGEDGR